MVNVGVQHSLTDSAEQVHRENNLSARAQPFEVQALPAFIATMPRDRGGGRAHRSVAYRTYELPIL